MRFAGAMPYLPPVERGNRVTIRVDGRDVIAFEGETVAGVLTAEGIRTFRHGHKTGEPRGMFCGMGVCFECRVTVDGAANVRACMTPVAHGMIVETGVGVTEI